MTQANKQEKSKYPIICIANDSGSSKIEKIRKLSMELEIKPPSKKGLRKFIEKIAIGENLDVDEDVITEIIDNSEPDFRQISNKLSYLVKLVDKNSHKKKIKVTMKAFDIIKGLTKNDKKLELTEVLDKIFLPNTLFEETLRLFETDINIISMSFYSNFTDNILKLDVSNKEKIKTLSKVSQYLVEGEIYSDFYWKNKASSLETYQCANQIFGPKILINDLVSNKKTAPPWDFTGKRIFYLNPHIMERYWKIAISLNIYSSSHLSYVIELIWNLIKSKKFISQEKIYRKIMFKLFDDGVELKDFDNIYKGFVLGTEDNKENDDLFKHFKIEAKKYFTEHQAISLKEFQVNLESIPSQLDDFLSI
jgi:hypothetical protein